MMRSARALGRLERWPFQYYYGNPTKVAYLESDDQRIGQMLWSENARSVRARYQDADASGMISELPDCWRWGSPFGRTPTPVETLKLIACYRYQACETGDFESTEAAAFCDALRSAAINALPGYQEAPWEWDERRVVG
jgi:hypothetical protein